MEMIPRPRHLWRKGQSGNPGGKPTLTPEQRKALEQARRLCPEAIAAVQSLLTHKQYGARLAAAKMILDIGLPLWSREHREGPTGDVAEALNGLLGKDNAEQAKILRDVADKLECA